MIQRSDNAAADLILDRLGDRAVRAALAEAGLDRHPQPLPILGIFLSWGNHEQGPLTQARFKKLSKLSLKVYTAEVKRLQGRYLDESWREAELAWRQRTPAFGSYKLQAQAAQALFPKSTARDYARLMAGVLQGTILSAEAVAVMRGHLGWPGRQAAIGSSAQNVLPFPVSLSTPMRPPWCSTIALQMARPSPVPPLSRLAAVSTWPNLSKTRW
jgi:hypothetical protein